MASLGHIDFIDSLSSSSCSYPTRGIPFLTVSYIIIDRTDLDEQRPNSQTCICVTAKEMLNTHKWPNNLACHKIGTALDGGTRMMCIL